MQNYWKRRRIGRASSTYLEATGTSQTKHNEIGTIEEIMNLETLYSIEFTGLNINLDNEQRSSQYHRYKDKGAGLVTIFFQ